MAHVAAQGHFQVRLGQRVFPLAEAVAMASDLRARGYADAHAEIYDGEGPARGPFALTLVVARGGAL